MPWDDPDPDDPNVLVGVGLPADRESIREMAWSFAEEFASMGLDESGLMALFEQPFYSGAHQAWTVLGATEIRRIVRESLGVWGGFRVRVQDNPGGEPARATRLVQIKGRLNTRG